MCRKIIQFILVIVVTVVIAVPAQAQQKITIKLADKSFEEFAFVEAIELYEYAYEKDPENTYVIRRLADANRNIGNTEETEKWLKILIDKRADEPEDLFNYSQALKSNGKYLQAEQWLQEYADLRPEDGRINVQQSLLDYIDFLSRDSSKYEIRLININSDGSEIGPAFYHGQVVFSSTSGRNSLIVRKYRWNELPYLDLYIGDKAPNGDILNVKDFAPKLRTNYHDGPVAFDQKNDKLYLTRNNVGKGRVAADKDGVVNLKILLGELRDDDWEYRGEFPYNSNSYSTGHPSIDQTGNVLYFTSDRPGGYGGSDLYFSVFANGYWSDPINLGPKVNTEGNESFPFISNDGVLYFSSDGHGGMGGMDIYFSVPEGGVFNKIENMGFPVNSPKDDFSFVLDSTGMDGYFASNRMGGRGNDDIYHLRIKYIPVFIRGVVKDRETGEVLPDTRVSIINEFADTIQISTTKTDGQFEFEVNKGHEYIIHAHNELYLDNEVDIRTNKLRPNDEAYAEVLLDFNPEFDDGYPEPLMMEEEDGEPLQILQIEYIDFEFGNSDIRKNAAQTLDDLIALMLQFPEMEIRIESHTDSRGDDQENLLISKRRAKAAFEYIISKGIDPMRIRYEGYGETRLLNKCDDGVDCTEAEHAVNRRTIVKVVRKGEYKGKRAKRSIFYF